MSQPQAQKRPSQRGPGGRVSRGSEFFSISCRLRPFTSYKLRLKATNDIGDSDFSAETEAVTTLQDGEQAGAASQLHPDLLAPRERPSFHLEPGRVTRGGSGSGTQLCGPSAPQKLSTSQGR